MTPAKKQRWLANGLFREAQEKAKWIKTYTTEILNAGMGDIGLIKSTTEEISKIANEILCLITMHENEIAKAVEMDKEAAKKRV